MVHPLLPLLQSQIMSQAEATKKPARANIILPFENFWRCYAAHLELYTAIACATALHALVLGFLVVLGLFGSWFGYEQAYSPPLMDVVEITGGGGTGGVNFGPGAGISSRGGKGKKKIEIAKSNQPKDTKTKQQPVNSQQKLKAVEKKKLQVAEIPSEQRTPEEEKLFIEIQKKAKEDLDNAKAEVAKSMGVSANKLSSAGTVNVGGSPGSGGGFGGGRGTGVGSAVGPGRGRDPNGRLLTRTEKRERRWLIDFSGTGPEHLKKLEALNITLALPTANPRFFRLVDFSGPQPTFKKDTLNGYTKRVKWFNQHKRSLRELAKVLRLRFVPKYVVIFLPEAMEHEMARLEVNYRGVPEDQINFTWFEIKQRDDGSYGPVVVAQR